MRRTAGSASLLAPLGIKVAYTPLGIVIALIFIGLPFVVRTVQPIMEEIDKEVEEAAATLGANRFQTITRVLFPGLAPAILTGFALAFARGVGEYGSVIFIAGNLPYKSGDRAAADRHPAGGVQLCRRRPRSPRSCWLLSFVMLLVINLVQAWSRKRYG